MSARRRVAIPLACAGFLGAFGLALVLSHSHASARKPLTYAHLTKIQKRIISSTLLSAIGPRTRTAPRFAGGDDEGGGPDGSPFTPPKSFKSANGGQGGGASYFPTSQGQCSSNFGSNVKVNVNCLNVSDPDLQGRGQANNEESIAQDPNNTRHIVASDNNYIRGDGTCGAHYSLDGGKSWADTTVPNGFTRGDPFGFPRQYWQAGGDTSVAWDTRGNAYLSCQLFNRSTVSSQNPDASSAFVIFRSTQNDGASFNFPGRYTTVFNDPTGTIGALEDKALMTVDNNAHSRFRDRIYVTWTEFAADGSAYIYEVHSDDYGETFSDRAVVSKDSPVCTNTFGAATPNGKCNENQFSDPFVGPDGNLYVAYVNFNNQPAADSPDAADYHYQVLLSKSTDGGTTFSPPVKVSNLYDLPNCDTYQGDGADPGRSCVPEKGSSTVSVFRATNYPSGQVDPTNARRVTVAFGSYINKYSNEQNGCTPTGNEDGNPTYAGVKTPGACNNKILLGVSNNGGSSFNNSTGDHAFDPRFETVVTNERGQIGTDQFWQWSAFTSKGQLAVDYYDRQYGHDETNGSSDFSLSGSQDLSNFGQVRVTSSSMPAPTQFEGPAGGQFYGDYIGLAAIDKAHPIWSDTRSPDLFVCPGTATPGTPPTLCGATEDNGQTANDEESFTATVSVPSSGGQGH
jgi:hypothetical protein